MKKREEDSLQLMGLYICKRHEFNSLTNSYAQSFYKAS